MSAILCGGLESHRTRRRWRRDRGGTRVERGSEGKVESDSSLEGGRDDSGMTKRAMAAETRVNVEEAWYAGKREWLASSRRRKSNGEEHGIRAGKKRGISIRFGSMLEGQVEGEAWAKRRCTGMRRSHKMSG